MHLLGRDGGMKNITIAVALVPVEDAESYSWFLRQVRQAGLSIAGVPTVTIADAVDRLMRLVSLRIATE